MSIAAILADVARGRPPAGDGLLGNCRLEWGGGEAYGEEAIRESFGANPLDLNVGTLIETPCSALWIGEHAALVADLYDGRVGRLWRLCAGQPPEREPAVAVAFDPDLQQHRGDVLIGADDHPELDPAAINTVTAAAGDIVAESEGVHRARAFVVRAFSSTGATGALLAVHRLGGGAIRASGFGYAAALIAGDDRRVVIDPVGPSDWTPRL